MSIKKLEEAMAAQGMSVDDLAKKTGIDRSTLYRRLKGGGKKITVDEMRRISVAMAMDERTIVSIFLSA